MKNTFVDEIKAGKDTLFLKLAFISISVLIFYCFFLFFIKSWPTLIVATIGAFLLIPGSILLYKSGRKDAGKLSLVFSCISLIYFGDMTLGNLSSLEYFYYPALMLPFLIFDFDQKKYISLSLLSSICAWSISEYYGLSILPQNWLSKSPPLHLLQPVNFVAAYVTSFLFIGIFVKNISRLSQKVYEHKEKESQDLREAQKLGKIGSWEFNVQTGDITWSKQMFSIFPEYFSKGEPSYEDHRATIHPDDVEMWENTVKLCLENHEALYYEISHL